METKCENTNRIQMDRSRFQRTDV